MKFGLVALALVGSALAVPVQDGSHRVPTLSTVRPASTTHHSTTRVPSHTSTRKASSTVTPTTIPICDVEHEGDNGEHRGWCKKAQHSGTYKNGKSD
ncbi:hypothetical protein NUU61_007162 [Penicillium alfredii]|uniref:Uncharacterized protein n=1 Tax=Penicillium alfredii TaxID=1506179 RepID=A0A9W9F2A3_9EURO|nr:uncharacterized protein NUU61_007162 [Penicillium alfredii]KAJ5092292.1 hypothetical protein NUU61_007162 [Penicillium alfredii]